MTTDKAHLSKEIAKKLTSQYTLEEDFVQDVQKLLLEVLAPYYVYNTPPGGKGKKGKNSGGKPRASTAYNQFVKAKMPEIKALDVPPKERMGKIGELWKVVTDAEKQTYQDLADAENATKATEAATEAAPVEAAPAAEAPPEAEATILNEAEATS